MADDGRQRTDGGMEQIEAGRLRRWEAGRLGSWEAEKLKAENTEQRGLEGWMGKGNEEMKRRRQRAWSKGHRDRRKIPEPEGECGSWLD